MIRFGLAVATVGLLAAVPAVASRAYPDRRISGHGIMISLPAPWHGRIYRRPGGLPILQAGNLQLPGDDDDVGYAAVRTMRRTNVFIVLLESARAGGGFSYPVAKLPIRIRRSDFLPLFKGVPAAHAFARRLFSLRGRSFQLWVQFGIRPAPVALIHDANRVLATLRITR
jgi:hypothetical protein